ncbi:hypothetical protein HUJ05_011354 [Dendroctonus ponderosae]|nr:hypothetical protein HUJ05_011354 [Dendroctonus ponderosae]
MIVKYSLVILEKNPNRKPLGLVVVNPTRMCSEIVERHEPSKMYFTAELAFMCTPISSAHIEPCSQNAGRLALTSVYQPNHRIPIAIAPFGGIVAGPQDATFTFPGPGQPPAPIVHLLVFPGNPPGKRLELLLLRRRTKQSGLLAGVLDVLSASRRPDKGEQLPQNTASSSATNSKILSKYSPIDQSDDLVIISLILNILDETAGFLESIHRSGGFVAVMQHGRHGTISAKLADLSRKRLQHLNILE